MKKCENKKSLYDEFRNSVLLRKYYETEVEPSLKYEIPFEFLYEEELEGMTKSLGFAVFKFRESISRFITKIANAFEYKEPLLFSVSRNPISEELSTIPLAIYNDVKVFPSPLFPAIPITTLLCPLSTGRMFNTAIIYFSFELLFLSPVVVVNQFF